MPTFRSTHMPQVRQRGWSAIPSSGTWDIMDTWWAQWSSTIPGLSRSYIIDHRSYMVWYIYNYTYIYIHNYTYIIYIYIYIICIYTWYKIFSIPLKKTFPSARSISLVAVLSLLGALGIRTPPAVTTMRSEMCSASTRPPMTSGNGPWLGHNKMDGL